jgi:hypothetical protein
MDLDRLAESQVDHTPLKQLLTRSLSFTCLHGSRNLAITRRYVPNINSNLRFHSKSPSCELVVSNNKAL